MNRFVWISMNFLVLALHCQGVAAGAMPPSRTGNPTITEYQGNNLDRMSVYQPETRYYSTGSASATYPARMTYPYDGRTYNNLEFWAWSYPVTRTMLFTTSLAVDANGDFYYKKRLPGITVQGGNSLGYYNASPGSFQLKIIHRKLPNGSSPSGQMDPPIVISQGFDPEHGTSKAFTFESFEEKLGKEFIYKILENGYCIVLVKYLNVTQKIEDNANAALRALQWIQSQSPNNDLTVIGPSMGGLIFRKALIEAGKENRSAENSAASGIFVKNFIAYDSPNWGAVIPMSIQAVARYLGSGGLFSFTTSQKAQLRNLTSPGASEMLLYQVPARTAWTSILTLKGYFWNPSTSTVTNTTSSKFLRTLNSEDNWKALKYVKAHSGAPMRVLAVTDGSASIAQGLPENADIGKGNYWTLDYHLQSTNPGKLNDVAYLDLMDRYSYRLKFEEPVFTENVPGGIRNTYTSTKRGFKSAGYPGKWNAAFLSDDENYVGHTFIPTISSAGIKASYADFNYKSTWILAPGTKELNSEKSWFDAVYINPDNQEHISSDINSPAKKKIAEIILGGQ